jgi:hypothetical protein
MTAFRIHAPLAVALALGATAVSCTQALDFEKFDFGDAGDAGGGVGGGTGGGTGGGAGGGTGGGAGGGSGFCGDGTLDVGEQCEAGRPDDHVTCVECVLGCATAYDDCNYDLDSPTGDGCESDLNDEATCGDCNTACAGAAVCHSTVCTTPTEHGFPSESGLETDPAVDYVFAYPITLPTTTVVRLGVSCASDGQSFAIGLYDSVDGRPGNLLASATGTTAIGLVNVDLAPPTGVAADGYWVALHFASTATINVSSAQQSTVAFAAQDYDAGFPELPAASWMTSTVDRPGLSVLGVP